MLRIKFTITDDSNSSLEISDNFEVSEIDAWFARCTQHVRLAYSQSGLIRLNLDLNQSSNKIGVIKLLRAISGCGLLEAKNTIEMDSPHIAVAVDNSADIAAKFVEFNVRATTSSKPWSTNAIIVRNF